MENVARPWPALWSLVIGFFMILIDTTIVSVANPSIMEGLNTDINSVIWVTSAYLLAYAVPLLITGRLGDRFGPKKLYLSGLVVFTMASLWCGLSGDVQTLIAARVVQGLGAAMMTPQTMAVITRIFPPDRRGAAMGIWGATAGLATLVGPILGGVLVDGLGWEWIFFINVPVGIAGFILAQRFVPALSTHPHKFDIPGVLLSALGLFLLVFGIQEGETYDWGTIAGPITVWGLIISGIAVLVVFVLWQRFNKGEPLLPLSLFKDRNFSLANIAITTVGFTVTAFSLPLIFYYQIVRGLTPTESALMMVPMALISGGLAPVVGRIIDKVNPKFITATGLVLMSVALFWNALLMHPDTPIWLFLLPSAVLGFANAGIWAPLSSTATRNLPPRQAGAGSGVYNTTRQIGAVLGSAAIAVLIQARLAAELPARPGAGADASPMGFGGALPEALHAGFSTAMGQSILLPAAVILLGAAVALFFAKPKAVQGWGAPVQPLRLRLQARLRRRRAAASDAATAPHGQGCRGARPALARRHPDQPSSTLVWMPPAEKPRLRANASDPLLLTSERHCSVSPAARASWAAIEAASLPSPRRRHSGATSTPRWARSPSHSVYAPQATGVRRPSSRCMTVKRCSRSARPTSLTSSGGQNDSSSIASGFPCETVSSSEGCCRGRSSAKKSAAAPSPWPPCPREMVSSVTCWASSSSERPTAASSAHCGPTRAELPNRRTNCTDRAARRPG